MSSKCAAMGCEETHISPFSLCALHRAEGVAYVAKRDPTWRELAEKLERVDPSEPSRPLPDRPYYVLPTGIQVKDVVAHLSYNIGVAAAYLFRAGRKPGNDIKDDIRKAIDHLNFELQRLEEAK